MVHVAIISAANMLQLHCNWIISVVVCLVGLGCCVDNRLVRALSRSVCVCVCVLLTVLGNKTIRQALIVCSVAFWFSSTHECPMPQGNGCCCIALRVHVFSVYLLCVCSVFALCACVCVCGWARFRHNPLAYWLGVLSTVSRWELEVGVGRCCFQ